MIDRRRMVQTLLNIFFLTLGLSALSLKVIWGAFYMIPKVIWGSVEEEMWDNCEKCDKLQWEGYPWCPEPGKHEERRERG